jgi:glycosyltransferase involved in cell wall biosynthesis
LPNTQPLVSVIIPFYNCRFVDQAIHSALTQTYSNIEVIVINDGSTKNQHLATKFLPRIKYFKQSNKGVAAALNTGIKHAAGEYIAWLSSDDMMNNQKIENQLKFMQEKGSEISFTNFNLFDENNKIVSHNVGQNYQDEIDVIDAFLRKNPINGCTIMMSKKVVEITGFFNENLKYAQDYEYWIRVSLKHPIHYYDKTLTNYRIHPSMGSILYHDDQMKEFHQIKERYTAQLNSLIKSKRENKLSKTSSKLRHKKNNPRLKNARKYNPSISNSVHASSSYRRTLKDYYRGN